MVLVTSTRPGIPCYSRPNSFPYNVPHSFRYLGLFMRCRISISYPVSSSKTPFRICIGNFLLSIFDGVTFSCAVSTHTIIASRVKDWKCVLLLVLYDGADCCVSSTLGNEAYLIFEFPATTNLGDRLGGITLSGGWVYLLLGSNCCIGLSTLRGGLVLLRNGGAIWVISVLSFSWYSELNFFLVSRFFRLLFSLQFLYVVVGC